MSFSIGPLTIQVYGIILMTGVIAAAFLADREAKRRNKNPDFLWDSLIWIVIGGVIGARLWHILTPSNSAGFSTAYYLANPLDAINILNGGLGLPGAVIGGGFALYLTAKAQKQNFLIWADIVIPGVALGQAIGRWGNYINQELYGIATDLPWGIFIDPENRIPRGATAEFYHPLFAYESLFNLANMFFLLWISHKFIKKIKPGDVFLVYLITYPFARFWLEFLRLDISQVGGININQTLMAITMVVSAGLLVYKHKYAKSGVETIRSRRKAKKKSR